MTRAWFWLQLVIGWLPMWALYAMLIASVHDSSFAAAGMVAMRAVIVGALLGLVVRRFTRWLPWPRSLRPGFLAMHAVAALVFAVAWQGISGLVEDLLNIHSGLHAIARLQVVGFVVTGVWLYVMVAGVSYAAQATERAAHAEALAARSQLAALRSQLNPHFLFNALHTVVQLIPREPRGAAQAAEQLAGLLRTSIEEDRDLVSLGEELSFVERYLAIERLRFGDRLQVRIDVPDEARAAQLPSFALQTLVENAVRHGAAPRVEPTDVAVLGRVAAGALTLSVRDSGAGAEPGQLATGGSGLRRLRERLAALFGDRARLDLDSAPGGFAATLVIPQPRAT